MPEMPKAFVGGDQAFHIASARAVRCQGPARQHHLQDVEKLLRNFEVGLVASVVKRDQDLV